MKEVFINFGNNAPLDTKVLIDDKKISPIKNEFGNHLYSYKTENENVNIKIYSYSEMSSKLWYFMSILYFFISLFGIFDVRPKKNGISIKAEFNYKLNDGKNHINLSYNQIQVGKEAVKSTTELQTEQIMNEYYINELLVKRYKRTKIIRTLILILSIALGVVLLII